MHEEVNQKVISLCIRTSKLTANVLAKAIKMFLDDQKRRANAPVHGRQTFRQLMEQNAGATSIEVDSSNIRAFDRVARRYNIDYAVRRDRTSDPPKYFVFFKARDQDTMTMAFREFVARNERRQNRPSFRQTLKKFVDLSMNLAKNMERERNRQRNRGQSL